MPLFEVAILQRPTKKEVEEGTGSEKLVFGPKPVVAQDNQSAAINAILENDTALPKEVDRARMQVIVRPFS